ncbi:hypothetical protein M0R72_07980 [Candidatus Pacearchaeota archaeon]|jgi:hypothetical protein|nr:hypothetical protein [Candidatus Pacearchaeota archaeon]
MNQQLQQLIQALEADPFYRLDGTIALPVEGGEPEGALHKKMSKQFCLSIATMLRGVDAELKELRAYRQRQIDESMADRIHRKNLLTELFDKLFAIRPIRYGELNSQISFFRKDRYDLLELERQVPKLGVAECAGSTDGVSALSLMATITDILCDDRLAFVVDDNSKNIIGTKWYSKYHRDEVKP